MSLYRPRKPSKPGARLSVWEKLFNGNGLFGDDSNGKWTYKSGVYFYKPNFPTSSSGGGKSSSVSLFKLVSDGGDYYNCYTFDGVTTGASIVKVAKLPEMCCILPSATPAGGAWTTRTVRGEVQTYDYVATAGATADGVNVLEYVRVVHTSGNPDYNEYPSNQIAIGDTIVALPASFAGPATLQGVVWQAINSVGWGGPDS